MKLMKPYLLYQDATMWSPKIGDQGTTLEEMQKLLPKLQEATKRITLLRETGEQYFFEAPFERDTLKHLQGLANQTIKKFTQLLVIGTGGSSLGGNALIQSLADELLTQKKKALKVSFLSNPDPEIIAPWLNPTIDWKHTAINVISKSGTTTEVMAIFLTVRKALIKSVGEKAQAIHVFVTTEINQNPLHKLALENGYTCIEHQTTVGGRFSVLSSVGLFPALCAGIDAEKLLKGAQWIEETHRKKGSLHPVALFVAHHYLAYQKKKSIHVLMPYAQRLSLFGQWYRQLWAESLGKISGTTFCGPTPVVSIGTVDQHSQIQLYHQGPDDKIITFIEVEKTRQDVSVPKIDKHLTHFSYLSGVSLTHLMRASCQGTANALAKDKRAHDVLKIPSISPESIGALIQFYEIAVVYFAFLLNVDPFNQPGVEEGKKQIKKQLSKKKA